MIAHELIGVFVTLGYFALAYMVIAIAIEIFGLIDKDRKIPGTDADRHRRL